MTHCTHHENDPGAWGSPGQRVSVIQGLKSLAGGLGVGGRRSTRGTEDPSLTSRWEVCRESSILGFPLEQDGEEKLRGEAEFSGNFAMQEICVPTLGQEDPLEEEMATHSSILAWEIPWTEEPERLQSMGSQRVGHSWSTNTFTFHFVDEPWPLTVHRGFLRGGNVGDGVREGPSSTDGNQSQAEHGWAWESWPPGDIKGKPDVGGRGVTGPGGLLRWCCWKGSGQQWEGVLGIPPGTCWTQVVASVRSSKGSESGVDRRSQIGQWCIKELSPFFSVF